MNPVTQRHRCPVVQAAQTDPWPALHRGSTGETVRSLQYLLRAHGRTVGVDGAFGPRTDAALRAFQGAVGLSRDGIVGPLTWNHLIGGSLSL